MADKVLGLMGRGGAVMAGLATIPTFCLFNVDGGERAVVFHRVYGVDDRVRGEGTHFMLPWFQAPFIYNIRTRPKQIQTTTGTKDLQTVTIHCRLLFKPRVEALPDLHKRLGKFRGKGVVGTKIRGNSHR